MLRKNTICDAYCILYDVIYCIMYYTMYCMLKKSKTRVECKKIIYYIDAK